MSLDTTESWDLVGELILALERSVLEELLWLAEEEDTILLRF
jgi:hypothetical protein